MFKSDSSEQIAFLLTKKKLSGIPTSPLHNMLARIPLQPKRKNKSILKDLQNTVQELRTSLGQCTNVSPKSNVFGIQLLKMFMHLQTSFLSSTLGKDKKKNLVMSF